MVGTTIVRRTPLVETDALPVDWHPVVRRIMSHRGIKSPDDLERSVKGLLPYSMLANTQSAAELLHSVLEKQARIVVVGDFDADGATSTALAVKALKMMGAQQVDFVVPNRFEYGYGLSPEIVEVVADKGADLIVTVDNGISSIEGVKAAKSKGIQVLVTDHHLPGRVLPDADVIVNPNLPDDPFPSKSLAGVGVIFYVMLALRAHLREQHWFIFKGIKEPNLAECLDLVALGTVADVVKLDKNNRILVHQGCARIRAGKCCQGIKALIAIAGRNPASLTTSDLGFAIGPRLNAAGRLDDMSLGIQCLLTEHRFQAKTMAEQLNALNKERRVIESDMKTEALALLENLSLDQAMPTGICVYDEHWHQGVIGILASRIKERFHRPVIAFAPGDANEIKGSARSIAGLHIRDALDRVATQVPGLIKKFGGHAMAAGLTIDAHRYDEFAQVFNQVVEAWLEDADLQKEILTDGELDFKDLNLSLAQLLRDAAPWGQGFPEPVFDGTFAVHQKQMLKDQHLKMTVAMLGQSTPIEAIAFNMDKPDWLERCQRVEMAYKLDINEFRGNRRLQLLIEHVREAEGV